jgi:hypothetical protein
MNVCQSIKSIVNVLFRYQVVTLAVYSYFITSIMARQWVEGIDEDLQKHRNSIDLYFPIFTMLQVNIFLNTQETKLYSWLWMQRAFKVYLCGCGGFRLQSITPWYWWTVKRVKWILHIVYVICKSEIPNWYFMSFKLSLHEVIFQSLFVLFSFSSTWDGSKWQRV